MEQRTRVERRRRYSWKVSIFANTQFTWHERNENSMDSQTRGRGEFCDTSESSIRYRGKRASSGKQPEKKEGKVKESGQEMIKIRGKRKGRAFYRLAAFPRQSDFSFQFSNAVGRTTPRNSSPGFSDSNEPSIPFALPTISDR